MTPLVSVLVTVYNREQYLTATLESILASSFTDFELIIVDDQSTDRSLEIAHKVASNDPRVYVFRNGKNLGDYANRMKAASLAKGQFLKYVDSDDLIYPYSLGVMVDVMTRDHQIGLAVSHSLPEDECPYPWVLSPLEAYQKQFLGRGCLSCGPTGAIIRRTAFEACHGFDPNWKVLSDIDLWLRMAAKHHVALMPPGLVWWRRHEGQEFTSSDAERIYRDLGFRLNHSRLTDSNCPLAKDEQSSAIKRINHRRARQIASLAIKQFRFADAWHTYQESGLPISSVVGAAFSKPPTFSSKPSGSVD